MLSVASPPPIAAVPAPVPVMVMPPVLVIPGVVEIGPERLLLFVLSRRMLPASKMTPAFPELCPNKISAAAPVLRIACVPVPMIPEVVTSPSVLRV